MPKAERKRKGTTRSSPLKQPQKIRLGSAVDEEAEDHLGEDEFGFKQKNALPLKLQGKLFEVARDQLLEETETFEEDAEEAEETADLEGSEAGASDYPDNLDGIPLANIENEANTFLAPPEWSSKYISTLADVLASRLEKIESNVESQQTETVVDPKAEEKRRLFEEVFSQQIRQFLHVYRSEKIPKVARLIPRLKNWEEVLQMTCPEDWTNQAMREMTVIFASAMNPRLVVNFYKFVLLPRIRRAIQRYKKLDSHLYFALKKAFYKPSAWFSGILMTLSEEGCTMREAVIIGSVLAKMSVPVLHASACLVTLAKQKVWFAPTSYFISVLLEKSYSLPAKVIDIVCDHFTSFLTDPRPTLPVLWHQSLLRFVEKYSADLEEEKRQKLRMLIKKHSHKMITPSIKSKLVS